MEATKFTLADGKEIMLTAEDVKVLKPQIDKAIADLDESIHESLKWRKRDEVEKTLESLSSEKLLQLAILNDERFQGGERDRTLTNRIRSELFKRNGLGYKQVGHMSSTQRDFLSSLGLDPRLFRR